MVVFYTKLHSELDMSGTASAILMQALVLNQWLCQPELHAMDQTAETVKTIPSLNLSRNLGFQYDHFTQIEDAFPHPDDCLPFY